jgi:hypothetical protein
VFAVRCTSSNERLSCRDMTGWLRATKGLLGAVPTCCSLVLSGVCDLRYEVAEAVAEWDLYDVADDAV